MIQLYGSGQSRSFRNLWALEESGLEYQYHHVKIGQTSEDGSRSSTYLRQNHQGKVPTLIHDDLVLTESAAILNYIAALSPEKNLIPIDISERAKYDNVSFFVLSDLEQALWSKGKNNFIYPKDLQIPDLMPTLRWEFKRSLEALKYVMEGKKFAVGSSFSCADILIAHTINWAERFEFDPPQPFIDYRDAMYSRPACLTAQKKSSA